MLLVGFVAIILKLCEVFSPNLCVCKGNSAKRGGGGWVGPHPVKFTLDLAYEAMLSAVSLGFVPRLQGPPDVGIPNSFLQGPRDTDGYVPSVPKLF